MFKNVLSSFIWKLLERGGSQILQFVIQLILARLLLPEDYGIVAIVSIFIAIANVFVQTGFNTALIQKKEADDIDYCSVLYMSIFVAAILYVIIFFTSPMIADFYDNKLLTPVLRVLSITLFLGAINSVQNAIIARNMDFKKVFFSSIGGIIISGIVGIVMAVLNYGVWALVVQQLINIFIVVITLFITLKWKPKLIFSFSRVKALFSYGWKLLVSSLIESIYNNIYDLIIGKKYSATNLAYYNKGKSFPFLIINNINSAIATVMLPAMSTKQDDIKEVKSLTRKSIMLSSYIMFPIMIGLIVVAEPLVSLILTDKWLGCVPFLQILCLSYLFYPISTANLQAINAIGRSDVFLKLEIIKKIIGISLLLLTIPHGITAMAFSQAACGIISAVINGLPNKKMLNYSYKEQIKDIIPTLLLSIVMGVFVYQILYLNLSNFVAILLQCTFGVIIYIALSFITKNEALFYIVSKIKGGQR